MVTRFFRIPENIVMVYRVILVSIWSISSFGAGLVEAGCLSDTCFVSVAPSTIQSSTREAFTARQWLDLHRACRFKKIVSIFERRLNRVKKTVHRLACPLMCWLFPSVPTRVLLSFASVPQPTRPPKQFLKFYRTALILL